jgi:leucyl-tRNA synthetase
VAASADWTYRNIATMRAQLKPMGLSLDWSRIRHLRPGILRPAAGAVPRHARGRLVYPARRAMVNWDPVDQTVLANEQVIDGKGWRSGAEVERRELTQWFFKISDYAEELLDAIDGLENWPDKVRTDAAQLDRQVARAEIRSIADAILRRHEPSRCITTRPDTLHGASFAAISPDHPLAQGPGGDARPGRVQRRCAAASAPPKRPWKRPKSAASTPG